jgi:hypothetical protein
MTTNESFLRQKYSFPARVKGSKMLSKNSTTKCILIMSMSAYSYKYNEIRLPYSSSCEIV